MADDSMSSSLSGPDSLKVFGEMSLDIGIDREGDCKLQKVSVIYDTNRRQKTWIHPVSLETFIFVEKHGWQLCATVQTLCCITYARNSFSASFSLHMAPRSRMSCNSMNSLQNLSLSLLSLKLISPRQ